MIYFHVYSCTSLSSSLSSTSSKRYALKPKLSNHPAPNNRKPETNNKNHGSFKSPYEAPQPHESVFVLPVLHQPSHESNNPGMEKVNFQARVGQALRHEV
mmetsp:Transcript_4205/g.8517  ORF Transcript_4205/g.8517 Transcript_4205/m.8517 type:complete len:100 (-) Transcript_4205:1487-1786(-)